MIAKHSILGRSNVATVRVEPRLCDQGQGAMPTVVNQFEFLKTLVVKPPVRSRSALLLIHC